MLFRSHRTLAILDTEIGSWGTSPTSRKLAREVIFELIEIENNFDQDSQIAIKSKLMAVNQRISNPNNRIKLNILDKSKEEKLKQRPFRLGLGADPKDMIDDLKNKNKNLSSSNESNQKTNQQKLKEQQKKIGRAHV